MNNALLVAALLVAANIANAAPVVYTNEASYMDALAAFGYPAISESFEDGTVWADSRNSIVNPGNTPAVTSPSYNDQYDPVVVSGAAGKRIDITGRVLSQNSQTPTCAMVLANGEHTFSCDSSGSYSLATPLDSNGQFKLQVYADGFAPVIQAFDEFSAMNDVRMARASECQ